MREERPRNRGRECEDNRKQRDFRPVRNEPGRSRPAGSSRHYADNKSGYGGKPSPVSETRAKYDSASMKFEWPNLLPKKPEISGCFGLSRDKDSAKRICSEYDNVEFSKIPCSTCPTEPNAPLTSSEERFAFKSKGYGRTNEQDHNVLYIDGCSGLKSSAAMNSKQAYDHGEYDSVCRNVASDHQDIFRRQKRFKPSIVDSIVEKVEGSYSYGGLGYQYGSGKIASDQDNYRRRNCFGHSIADSITEKVEGSCNSHKVFSHYGDLDNQELVAGNASGVMVLNNKCSGSRSSYVSKGSRVTEQDGECSGSRGFFRGECGSEVNVDRGGLQVEKDFSFGGDGIVRNNAVYKNVGRSKETLIEEVATVEVSSRDLFERGISADYSMTAQNPRHQDIRYENEDGSQPMLVATRKQSERIVGKGRIVDSSIISQRKEHNMPVSRITPNKIYNFRNRDEQWISEDIGRFGDVKSLGLRKTVDEMARQDLLLPSPLLPSFMQEHLREEPVRLSKIDIKKRVGCARSIKDRLGPVQSRKKHLGYSSRLTRPSSPVTKKSLAPSRNIRLLMPQVKGQTENRSCNGNLDELHRGSCAQGGDSNNVNMKSSNSDPPEQSERFQLLVQKAFMKFMKALNENQAQKKKFTEQASNTLRCSVCGSYSKVFRNTMCLAEHAFHTKTAGLRAEHLGFHKALCVLMGWNYGASPNGSWNQRILPASEALALKQDLIIWPPVVFIHNSSIGNTNPDKQMIVSNEQLRDIIRGMGFGRAITKVCCGKAANQSIMVVIFHGTFSGLQESENLHKFYAENKHGRAEFQHITSRNYCSIYKSRPADKVESFLYGYLGNAEDLDKLEFEANSRFLVKSKKEIQAIANAPLGSECQE